MKRLLSALFLLIPLVVASAQQGTSVRALNGIATNLTFAGGVLTNLPGTFLWRLGANANGTSFQLIDTNGNPRFAISGGNLSLFDTNKIRFRVAGDGSILFWDTFGSNQVSITTNGMYLGAGLVVGTTNEAFFADRSVIAGDFTGAVTPTITAEGGSWAGVSLVSSTGANVTAEDGSYVGVSSEQSTDLIVESQEASFAIAFAPFSINAEITSVQGSFVLANVADAINAEVEAQGGSYSGGNLQSSSDSSISSDGGSLSFGYLVSSTNSSIVSDEGGISVGNLGGGTDNTLESGPGSFALALLAGAFNSLIDSQGGSIAAVNGETASGLDIDSLDGSLVVLYANSKTNIQIDASRSLIVGSPDNEYSASFESTIAVLGLSGVANGFDTNFFFGNGLGLTNVLEKNTVVTTNTWGNAVVDFSRGTSIETNMAGALTITGITGFVTSNLNWQVIRLLPGASIRTVTVPDPWVVSGFTTATTVDVPANAFAKLSVEAVIGRATNATMEIFTP